MLQKPCQNTIFALMKHLFIILLALLAGCSGHTPEQGEYQVVYSPRYAARFEIGKSGDTTILVIRDPWQGAVGVKREYRFVVPHERIICMSSSHTAFLEAIGEADAVCGVSGRDFMHSPAMQSKVDIGYDRNLAYEKIVSLRPDAMTVYEVSGENSSVTQKLEQLGVPIIYIADYLESDPLGRAEWIVAFGALVGRQAQAEQIFDSIAGRYNKLRDGLVITGRRPTVMLNSPYRDVWYMPGDSNYMVRLIRDGGGDYLGGGVADQASRPISVEKAYSLLLKADFWLNPTTGINSRTELMSQNPNFGNIGARVFSSNARSTAAGGSDFWESGVVNPDVTLLDLIKILHPDKASEHEFYYFEELK